MTNHRKILEGVSEGPWYKHRRYKVITNDAGAALPFYSDFEFIIYARNHWESICDLIDAAERLIQIEREKWEDGLRTVSMPDLILGGKSQLAKVKAALDKLNEES